MNTRIRILLFSIAMILFANSAFAKIVHITVDGGIAPGAAAYIKSSVEYAEEEQAEALIITLNTPGGLLDATRDIVGTIMSSKVPVVVYIAPGGARAGSAGVFITLAAHVAAMAPGTNIGAAHPVGMGGQAPDSIMGDKITNDAAAFVRSIANERNKNIDWAERTVRESISATEQEAYLAGAIDFIAPSFDSLLIMIHGKVVKTEKGEVTILTEGIAVEERDMNWREEFLFWISNPNIAYILLMIGIYGLMFEFWSPGSIFPGVLGGISLLLAFYSLQMLPLNYTGLFMIILAVILFVLEIKVTSYGLLTIGGIISLTLGSIMLIDAPYKFMDISMSLIISIVIVTALFFAFLVGFGVKAQMKQVTSGNSVLVHSKGIALNTFGGKDRGQVKIFGEIWTAVSDDIVVTGDEVFVQDVTRFVLKVKKSELSV